MKKSVLFLSLFVAVAMYAEAPAGYYAEAEGKTGETLRQALFNIITNHVNVGYDGLWNVYSTSDITDDGKIWDMYSTCNFATTNKCGNYSSVCDCYNREHSVPQSWFNEASPMKADAFHVYPTDGKVNGQRSNYEYGECSGGTSLGGKALGRLGNSTFSGYTSRGTVFEPVDEYKGDFARTYFYMATCYADKCSSWGKTFGSNSGLDAYGVALFMKWHRNDEVSEKETRRNDAVYAKQKNRNPFIDHPELAEYIWGNKKGEAWYSGETPIQTVTFREIAIAPNPVTDFVTITTEVPTMHYAVVSLSGQVLLQGTVASGEALALGDLANGMYLFKLQAEGKTHVAKIVVNK
ncbi:MAG: endonuclease [Paludibacteraceae bacterium]